MKTHIIQTLDSICSTKVLCSIGDVLLRGNALDNGQLIVISRYYDVLRYMEGSDRSFPFQNALSYVLWGDRHDRETGDRNFGNLIASYERSGYKKGSRIVLYNDGAIANGTHRLALNLYHSIWEVEADLLWRPSRNQRNIDWYIEQGLSPEWRSALEDTGRVVEKRLFDAGATFVVVTEQVDSDKLLALEKLMAERSKTHMMERIGNTFVLRFSLITPDYYVRKGHLHSRTAEDLFQRIDALNIAMMDKAYNAVDGRRIWEKYRKVQ